MLEFPKYVQGFKYYLKYWLFLRIISHSIKVQRLYRLKLGLLLHFILYNLKFHLIVQFLFFLGGNVICLDFWGRKSGPYIQALHFCLSLGLLTGPLLVDPLSQTHVPNVLQKALPFALSHPGKIVVEEWYCLIKLISFL